MSQAHGPGMSAQKGALPSFHYPLVFKHTPHIQAHTQSRLFVSVCKNVSWRSLEDSSATHHGRYAARPSQRASTCVRGSSGSSSACVSGSSRSRQAGLHGGKGKPLWDGGLTVPASASMMHMPVLCAAVSVRPTVAHAGKQAEALDALLAAFFAAGAAAVVFAATATAAAAVAGAGIRS